MLRYHKILTKNTILNHNCYIFINKTSLIVNNPNKDTFKSFTSSFFATPVKATTLTYNIVCFIFTKYSIFIVDVKSGRVMYQSRRAGDEAKKRNSPAKSERVGIDVIVQFSLTWPYPFAFYSTQRLFSHFYLASDKVGLSTLLPKWL